MKPQHRTRAAHRGACDCGVRFDSRNAIGLAAQHAERFPDHTISVERTIVYAWGPGVAPLLEATPVLHRQAAFA